MNFPIGTIAYACDVMARLEAQPRHGAPGPRAGVSISGARGVAAQGPAPFEVRAALPRLSLFYMAL